MRDQGKSGSGKSEAASREPSLKVLHVIVGLQLGGAETLLYRLVTRSSPGIEHRIICLTGPDWYSPLLETAGIRVDHLGVGAGTPLFTANRRLGTLISATAPDVIQGWMYAANVLSALWCRKGPPVVWGIHSSSLGPVGLTSRMFAYAGGLLARWLPAFVINCSTRSAEMHARLGYSAAPGAVIHNGYDPEAFHPDEKAREATRQRLSVAPDKFLVGSIGRWTVQKDIPNLLAAIRIATDRGVPLHCLLAGRELEEGNPELAKQIRAAGCENLVTPLGPQSDVQSLARALDLHVLASSGGEAFPNVVAETMLSGTPNAVTDVGDSGFMVGETGWVVPPHDPRALADAIENAWREGGQNSADWERRRSEARRRIADNFTFERMAAAYEDVWRKVVAARQ